MTLQKQIILFLFVKWKVSFIKIDTLDQIEISELISDIEMPFEDRLKFTMVPIDVNNIQSMKILRRVIVKQRLNFSLLNFMPEGNQFHSISR
jgi:hypothetical protein